MNNPETNTEQPPLKSQGDVPRFTPGPWYAGHFADDTHSCNCKSVVSECYAGGICQIDIDNGLSIRDGGNDAPPAEEAKANMRLIAAEPDLYAALVELADILESEEGGDVGPCIGSMAPAEHWLGMARAAISKATSKGQP